MVKWTNNDIHYTTQEAKDQATWATFKNGGELRCSVRVSSSCSNSGTRRVTLLTNPVISHKWGKYNVASVTVSTVFNTDSKRVSWSILQTLQYNVVCRDTIFVMETGVSPFRVFKDRCCANTYWLIVMFILICINDLILFIQFGNILYVLFFVCSSLADRAHDCIHKNFEDFQFMDLVPDISVFRRAHLVVYKKKCKGHQL